MEKKTYRLELDEDEIYLALQCMRIEAATDVEDMREIAMKKAKNGENWEDVIENQDKMLRRKIDVHHKMIDQWCDQCEDIEDAKEWNSLKTNMEITKQNWDIYKTEIEKAASERRPVLHIVK